MLSKEQITEYFKTLQDNICKALEEVDAKAYFQEDPWTREEGGGGRTRVIQNGHVIEKGGVAFSAVHGKLPAFLKKELNIEDGLFYATGVSIVIHPLNPMVPIIHMNVRYFEVNSNPSIAGKPDISWFGGGIDLTPHYVVTEDAKYFHHELKTVCDRFDPSYYPEFKKWADDYFFITHRNETRGIGGIFFDRLSSTDKITIDQRFDFVKGIGEKFAPIYTHFMNKNKSIPFGEREKTWQLLRRGRYAEFNLVLDKGTKFGLETNGRVESILMSLPPQANWQYNYKPEQGSLEEKTISFLKKGIEYF